MDNINNNSENLEGGFTYPAQDGGASVQDGSESVQETPVFSQGKYPQPPEWTKNIVVSDKPWIPDGENGNVSVQFNESEKELPPPTYESIRAANGSEKKEWPMWMQLAIVALAAIVVFVMMKYVSQVRKPSDEIIASDVNAVTVIPTAETTGSVTAPTTAPALTTESEKTSAEEEKSTAPDKKEEKPSANKKPSSDKEDNKEKAKTEVIKYFNESSNRVKAEAVKVVKNFENRSHDEDKLELPGAIKSIGKNILESKISDITEPVEYTTHEDIISKYPAPGGEWSSALRAQDVEEATCVEKGDEYEITLKLYDCVDPEPGVGPSRAMDCLDVPEVRETAPPFITSFSAEYYDCVIRCRAEKETGRIIWSNYTSHVVVKVGLNAGFTQFDAQIGLTFEKDYTVTY